MDEDLFRKIRTRPPEPAPCEPHPDDPAEAAMLAQVEARGERHAGEIIPEDL